MSTDIWMKDTFKSDYRFVIGHTIVEYDMKSANVSLAREFNLLPEKRIKQIESLGKQDRVVAIGMIKRDDKTYNEKEKAAFQSARKLFFEMNDLELEDIIAIKRDAIFVKKYVKNEQLTKNINFRMKHEYTSYMSISNQIQLFYNKDGIDVKGIDDDVYEKYHKDYFGAILSDIMRRLEISERTSVLKTIRSYYDNYKWRKLDIGCYRQFNSMSQFTYNDGESTIEDYRGDISELDIRHNLEILLTITRMLL